MHFLLCQKLCRFHRKSCLMNGNLSKLVQIMSYSGLGAARDGHCDCRLSKNVQEQLLLNIEV